MTELIVSRIDFDANECIYAAEGSPEIAEPLQGLFRLLRVRTGTAVTSDLTLAELLPTAAAFQRRYYLNLIDWNGIFDVLPVSRDPLIETASDSRITSMPKLADAVHIVTAMRSGCGRLLSGDRRMRLAERISMIGVNPEDLAQRIRELS